MTSIRDPGEGLRTTAYKATRWQALDSIIAQAITFASAALLARLLDARDFGLVAAVMLLVGLYDVFLKVGLSSNLVRVRHLENRAVSTTHWAMAGLGAAVFVTAVAGAGPLARLIGSDGAAPLFRVASVVLLLTTLTSTPYALLLRRLAYNRLVAITISSNVAYLLCAVTLAGVFHLGAWAVVVGRVVQASLQTVLAFAFAGWRPAFTFDRGYLKGAASFAGGMWLAWVGSYVAKNADYALLSRLGTGEALGIYYLAFTVPQLLRQRFTGAMQQVLFPILVRTQGDAPRTRRILGEGYETLSLVLAPAMAGLAVIASDVVRLAFGPGWEQAVAPLRLLAVAGFIAIFAPLAASALEAAGKPGRSVVPTVLQTTTMVAAFLLLRVVMVLPTAMAGAVLVAVVIRAVADGIVLSRAGVAPALLWLRASYRPVLAAMLMSAAVAALQPLVDSLPLVLRVAISVGVGMASYGLLINVLDPAGFRRGLATVRGILGRGGREGPPSALGPDLEG